MAYRKLFYQIIVFFLLLITPALALADMGTPVILKGFVHLLFGNLLIGILEGLLIVFLFNTERKRTIRIMILANYATMLTGVIILSYAGGLLHDHIFWKATIYNAREYVAGFFVVTFLITIILEWPFCYWALRGKDKQGQRSLYASIAAQTASYAILIPFYIFGGGTSLYGANISIEPSSYFASDKNAYIYFVSLDDKKLCRINLDGKNLSEVNIPHFSNSKVKLSFKLTADGKYLNLYVNDTLLKVNAIPKIVEKPRELSSIDWTGSFSRYGPAADLRPEGQRDLDVETMSFYGYKGLRVKNKKSGEVLNIGYNELPVTFHAVNATVLPNNQVVFQFGEQIILLDVHAKKLGLITMGHSPVVILN